MNDVVINGVNFKLRKMDAIHQFHITRRLAPMLSDMMLVANNFKNKTSQEDVFKVLEPIVLGISKLNDADSEYVLLGLLCFVEMQQGTTNWAKIVVSNVMGTERSYLMMIQNLDLALLLQLAGRVFMFNMAGFFNGLPQK